MPYALGRATAHRLVGAGSALVVGQDTRRSGDMFVAAIAAGATALGVDVHVVGRPARRRRWPSSPAQAEFAAGIMVSASHNPAEDNGLKVLDERGLKLDDDVEDELEALIWRADELPGVPKRASSGGSSTRGDAARPLPRAPARARRPITRRRPHRRSTAPTGPAASSAPEILAGDRRRRRASSTTSPTA